MDVGIPPGLGDPSRGSVGVDGLPIWLVVRGKMPRIEANCPTTLLSTPCPTKEHEWGCRKHRQLGSPNSMTNLADDRSIAGVATLAVATNATASEKLKC